MSRNPIIDVVIASIGAININYTEEELHNNECTSKAASVSAFNIIKSIQNYMEDNKKISKKDKVYLEYICQFLVDTYIQPKDTRKVDKGAIMSKYDIKVNPLTRKRFF